MAWNFRRRVKIIPGVHLNFSKRGISTSIGIKGLGMTFGSSGTYLNTSIPGAGIYNRKKLSKRSAGFLHQPFSRRGDTGQLETRGNVSSADIHEITSQGMKGIKETILLARKHRASLHKDLSGIRRELLVTIIKKTLSYVLLYGLIKKSIPYGLSEDIRTQREAIEETKVQIKNSFVKLEADFDLDIKKKYESLVTAFIALCGSSRIWDVTNSHFENRAMTRSSAGTVITRRKVNFCLKSIPEFDSEIQGLYFRNANGADLYIYPGFIVVYGNNVDFAVIGLDEIALDCRQVRFTETEKIPSDAKIIAHTWAKVNKNGTPDRRFKKNYRIPVAGYGELLLRTNTGLNEMYLVSDYNAVAAFSQSFKEYRRSLPKIMK